MKKFIRIFAICLAVATSMSISQPAEAKPKICGAIENFIATVPYDGSLTQNAIYSYFFTNCYGEE